MCPTPLDLLHFAPAPTDLAAELAAFADFGSPTLVTTTPSAGLSVPTYVNEFWTARQRASHTLHEISYRACFKPALPRFFIERLTAPGELVYDPFMGRGTTLLEAALLGRAAAGNDANPLASMLIRPRLAPSAPAAIARRLAELELDGDADTPPELLVFYHPETLRELCRLRAWFIDRERAGTLDPLDDWLRMVALNRLTGHSPGFFSVYTLPPNQAVSVASQRRINERRGQTPPRREIRPILLKKSRQLLSGLQLEPLPPPPAPPRLLTGPAAATPALDAGSVALVVTSPPFLKVVQYEQDNWLRCWFAGIDPAAIEITMERTVAGWRRAMSAVFIELARVLRPGGHVAFEVGEVDGGRIGLEAEVIPCMLAAGLEPLLILINAQQFTKTSNCWGVTNNARGTNSNRVVVARKP